MSEGYNRLFEAVVRSSEASDWEGAVMEWRVVGCFDNGDASGTCVCGHDRIRYEFTICNALNGCLLEPIGSTCIEKFEGSAIVDEMRDWMAALKLLEAFRKHGLNRFRTLPSEYFSRSLIRFMHEKGAFTPSPYNRYQPVKDRDFMLKVFNMRKEPTKRQQQKVWSLLSKCVEPWLNSLSTELSTRKATGF